MNVDGEWNRALRPVNFSIWALSMQANWISTRAQGNIEFYFGTQKTLLDSVLLQLMILRNQMLEIEQVIYTMQLC